MHFGCAERIQSQPIQKFSRWVRRRDALPCCQHWQPSPFFWQAFYPGFEKSFFRIHIPTRKPSF